MWSPLLLACLLSFIVAETDGQPLAVLADGVCMGAKNDRFAVFDVPQTIDAAALVLRYRSGGVSCNTQFGVLAPFSCLGVYSIGLVCEAQPTAFTNARANGTLVASLQTTAAAVVSQQVDGLRMDLGMTLHQGWRCAVVYLEDWLNRNEATASDTSTCMQVAVESIGRTQSLARVPSAVIVPYGALGWRTNAFQPQWTSDSAGWVLTSRVSGMEVRYEAAPAAFAQNATQLQPVSLAAMTVSYGVNSATPAAVLPATTLRYRAVAWPPGQALNSTTLAGQCDSNESVAQWSAGAASLIVALQSTLNVTGVAYFTAGTSFETRTSDDGFATATSSGIVASALAAFPAPSMVFCVRDVASDASSYQIASLLTTSCVQQSTQTACESGLSGTFCAWAAGAGCCTRNLAYSDPTVDETHNQRCRCTYASEFGSNSVNAACSVGASTQTLSNLVAFVCSAFTNTTLAANCVAEFKRCPTMSTPLTTLLDSSLSRTCVNTQYATCLDPSRSCTVPTPVPATPQPPTAPPTPQPPLDSVRLLPNPSIFTKEQIQAGTAVSRIRIFGETTAFNLTRATALGSLTNRWSFDRNIKFGFEDAAIGSNASRAISDYEIEIRFGPFKRFSPMTDQRIFLNIPKTWFIVEPVLAVAPIEYVLTGENDDLSQRGAYDVILVVTATASLLSGPGGWMGLVAMQGSQLMVSSPCAESKTNLLFQNGDLAVSPWGAHDDGHRFVFGVLMGILMGLLVVHAAIAFLHHRIFAPYGSFKSSAAATWFPLPFLYVGALQVIAVSRAGLTGVIDDDEPQIQIVFFVAWSVFTLIFLAIWYGALRRGRGGFFLRYDGTQHGLQSEMGKGKGDSSLAKPLRLPSPDGYEPQQRSPVTVVWEKIVAGLAWLFIPTGHWPLTREWGVLRGILSDRAGYFSVVYLILAFITGANAGHRGDDLSYCYAFYWNYSLINVFQVLLAFYMPFRMRIMNGLWLMMRALELGYSATSAQMVIDNDPEDPVRESLTLYAVALVSFHLIFAALNFSIVVVEELLCLSRRRYYEYKRDMAKRRGDDLASALDVPLLDLEGLAQANAEQERASRALRYREYSFSPSPQRNPVVSTLPQVPEWDVQRVLRRSHSKSPSPTRVVAPKKGVPQENRRTCVEIHPLAPNVGRGELMMLFAVYGAMDVLIVGNTGIVGLPSYSTALAAVASFNGRPLQGDVVHVRLLSDDESL